MICGIECVDCVVKLGKGSYRRLSVRENISSVEPKHFLENAPPFDYQPIIIIITNIMNFLYT